jgi:hypothetical protein
MAGTTSRLCAGRMLQRAFRDYSYCYCTFRSRFRYMSIWEPLRVESLGRIPLSHRDPGKDLTRHNLFVFGGRRMANSRVGAITRSCTEWNHPAQCVQPASLDVYKSLRAENPTLTDVELETRGNAILSVGYEQISRSCTYSLIHWCIHACMSPYTRCLLPWVGVCGVAR